MQFLVKCHAFKSVNVCSLQYHTLSALGVQCMLVLKMTVCMKINAHFCCSTGPGFGEDGRSNGKHTCKWAENYNKNPI